MEFDSRTLRDALGRYVTGVTVITTLSQSSQKIGITANSFNSVSLQPPLVLWSVDKKARSFGAFHTATHFAVHVLAEDQRDISKQFASAHTDKFNGITTQPGLGGVPILQDCAVCLECAAYAQHPAGDHVIYIAEVKKLTVNKGVEPLVYHRGDYRILAKHRSEPI
ncbi:MAG: flavin reductase family protein [Henriciella sp.]